jgi:RNA polymerase sigma factor (sigma-70 family)
VLLHDGAGLSDSQLLDRYLGRGEEAAVAALVRRHGPMVWGVCRRVLNNHHDAEDAFQATFLVLVRKAASIASKELLANWLYGVAHQTALKARTTLGKRNTRERQVMQMPEPTVAERDLANDLQPLLDGELSRLPAKYRTVIVLCDLEGKTRKEAAQQLRLPEGTVGSRLGRARTMLAKRLARHGLAVSAAALATALPQSVASAAVPTSVMTSTIKAATLVAAGQATASAVLTAKSAALMEGVLKSMLMSKLKIGAAVLLAVAAVVVGSYTLSAAALQAEPPQAKAEPKKEVKPSAAATESPKPAREEGRLEGRFTDAATGKPVAGAKVRVLVEGAGETGASLTEGTSDADGRYAVKVPFGSCNVWGVQSPAGYFTQDPKTYGIFLTSTSQPAFARDFVLQRGSPWRAELHGAATTPGKPAYFNAWPEQTSRSGESIAVNGDLEGKAVLTLPVVGGRWTGACSLMTNPSPFEIPQVKLEIDKDFDPRQIKGSPESVPERKAVRLRDAAGRSAIIEGVEVAIDGGEAVLRFRAKPITTGTGFALRGRAVDESGRPVAGAKFIAAFTSRPSQLRGGGRGGAMSTLAGTTNAQGIIEIADLRLPQSFFENEGAISLVVVKAGFDGVQTKELDLAEVKQAAKGDFGEIVMKAGRALHGKVVDENGAPVQGAIITNHTNYFLYGHLRCRTDAEGKFIMPDLSYGNQKIDARYGDRNGQVEFQFDAKNTECLITVKPITPLPSSGMRAAPVTVKPPKPDAGWNLTPPLKEPKYQHEPKYALLVFGPRREQRVWMVLDGHTLYVDRNGNGDLTEPDKRIEANNPKDGSNKFGNAGSHTHFDILEFTVAAGVGGNSKFRLDHWIRDEKYVPKEGHEKKWHAEWLELRHENATLWRKEGSGRGQTPVVFMPKPADAQVCALDGPLTFVVKLPEYQVLQRSEAGGDVAFHIVVMGRPHRGAEREFYNPLATREVPEGAHLEVEIDFPGKGANAAPVHRKYLLKNRC